MKRSRPINRVNQQSKTRDRLRGHRQPRFEQLEERRLLTAYNLLVATFDNSAQYSGGSAGSSVLAFSEATGLRVPGGVYTGDHGLGEATGLAVAPDGSYYVSNLASAGIYGGQVLHYSKAGVFLNVLGADDAVQAPIAAPGTLAFGPNGNLYVADLYSNAIFQFNVNSTTQQYQPADTLWFTTDFAPGGFTFANDSTHDLIVGGLDSQSVVRDHDGTLTTLIAPGSGIDASSILALSNGNLLIGDFDYAGDTSAHHQILEYNASTKAVTQFIDLSQLPASETGDNTGVPTQPESMIFDADGNLLVGVSPDHNDNGAVLKFNVDTGAFMSLMASGIGTPSGLALEAIAPSDILFSTFDDTNGSSVLRYNDVSQLPVPGGVAMGTGGLAYAEGVAVAPDGSYYVSSLATDAVLHFSNTGQFLGDLGSGDANPVTFADPGTLAFGPNGNLYVADLGAGVIYQFDTSSATQQFQPAGTFTLPSGFTPGGFTFAPDSTNDLIVGDLNSGAVVRFHGGSETTLVAAGSVIPLAILPLSNGNLLIADSDFYQDPYNHHEIMEYNAATGVTTQFIDLTTPVKPVSGATAYPPQPTSLAFDADGNLLVGLSPDETSYGAIEKFNITTGALMSTIASGLGAPSGIALVPSQTSDLLAGVLSNADLQGVVLRYSTAAQKLVGGGAAIDGTETSNVAVAPDGSYYVGDLSGQVLHYSNSGVFLNYVGSGYFYAPGTMAFGPNGNLYIADLGYDVIYQFDVNSPPQPVSEQTFPQYFTPAGFTFAFDSNRDLIVGDYNSGEVLQCNPDGSFTTLVPASSTDPINPLGLLALSNGDLLIADAYHNQILDYDLNTTPPSLLQQQTITLTSPVGTGAFAGYPPQPTSLLLDPDGNLVVGLSPDESTTDGAVQTYDLATGQLLSTQISSIGAPAGLAYIPPVEMSIPASDWTSEGLTIAETSDGMLHVYTTGTTTDVITPQAADLVGGIEIVGADNAANTLTIDYSGGDPIPPDGVSFYGGLGTATNSVAINDPAATGTLSLSSSQLNLTNVQSISLDVGSGAFDLGDLAQSVGSVTITGGSLAVSSGTINGNLTGAGGLVKTGSSTVTLSGANNYQGGTTVTDGTLIVTSADSLPDGSSLTVGEPIASDLGTAVTTTAIVTPSAAVGSSIVTTPAVASSEGATSVAVPATSAAADVSLSIEPAVGPIAVSAIVAASVASPAYNSGALLATEPATPIAAIFAAARPTSAAKLSPQLAASSVGSSYNDSAGFAANRSFTAAERVAWWGLADSSSNLQDASSSDRRIAALDAVLAEYGASR